MNRYIIEISTNNSFSFVHLVNGTYYKVHILYDVHTDRYYINIDKFINGVFVNIINSINVITGINLLLQYNYFDIGKLFIIPVSDKVISNEPNASTIKNNYFILWEHN